MRVDPIATPNRFTVSTGRVVATSFVPLPPFAEIFREQLHEAKELSFSKHAQLRISERNMNLSPEQLSKIGQAVEKAGQKGVKDTLVLMDQMAFIVNVPSTTVITAMNGEDLKENVFTNIDGTVIV